MDEKEKLSLKERVLKRKKLIIFLVVIGILGFGAWRYFTNKSNGEVETATVERGDVVEELILSGEVKADEYAQLKFPASGKVAWVDVTEGEEVYKGQPLISMDKTVLNSALQTARSNLRSADATAERTLDDVKDNDDDETFTQKETRTIAEVAKDNAYEAVLVAEENMRNATLYAPFAGMVTFVANPFAGVNMLFSEIQVEVLNPETIYFDVSADQSEVNELHVGQKVNIVLDSFPEDTLEGKVVFISYTPKADEAGTVYKVRVNITGDNLAQQSRIGMTGDAKFVLSEMEDVLWVPPEFVSSDKEGKYVNLSSVNNKVYIEVGAEGEERVEITGEVNEGDMVYD
jgi:RND family efflux transporter MFP subunit